VLAERLASRVRESFPGGCSRGYLGVTA
jgi:hypothetical protein